MKTKTAKAKRTAIILLILLLLAAFIIYKAASKPGLYWGIAVRFEDTSSEEEERFLLSQFVSGNTSTILDDGVPHNYSLLFMNRRMNRKKLLPIQNELLRNEMIRDAEIIRITDGFQGRADGMIV